MALDMNLGPKGKIVQKYKILFISRNFDLSLKLETTRQDESRSIFIFQNGALDERKSNFHAKRCKIAYFEKQAF